MNRTSRQGAFISSMMDLCAEIDRLCGSTFPARDCREIGLEFHNRGYRDFNDDASAFIEEIFADNWIWGEGGEVKQPELYDVEEHRPGTHVVARARWAEKQHTVQVYVDPGQADEDLRQEEWVDLCWSLQDALNRRLERGEAMGSKLYSTGFEESHPPQWSDEFVMQALVSAVDTSVVTAIAEHFASMPRYVPLHAHIEVF